MNGSSFNVWTPSSHTKPVRRYHGPTQTIWPDWQSLGDGAQFALATLASIICIMIVKSLVNWCKEAWRAFSLCAQLVQRSMYRK